MKWFHETPEETHSYGDWVDTKMVLWTHRNPDGYGGHCSLHMIESKNTHLDMCTLRCQGLDLGQVTAKAVAKLEGCSSLQEAIAKLKACHRERYP